MSKYLIIKESKQQIQEKIILLKKRAEDPELQIRLVKQDLPAPKDQKTVIFGFDKSGQLVYQSKKPNKENEYPRNTRIIQYFFKGHKPKQRYPFYKLKSKKEI